MSASAWVMIGAAVGWAATGAVFVHYSFRPWWRLAEGRWLWGKLLVLFALLSALLLGRIVGGIGLIAWAFLLCALAGLQVVGAFLYFRAQGRRVARGVDNSISSATIES